ncbi:MAG: hypothetical protein E6J71_14345 [Deltaproteobacteria bacterium]|nr:MAG: hypothetical protein E6J77_15540 [Deltaproteobacteria bacterium]TMB17581.1 MAG: hypothetical protein E6J71_14345 [Deltaproteobacteria bacterium]
MRRKLLFLGAFLAHAVQAVANDWGMGEANSKIAPSSIFQPISTPAHEISTIFVLAVTTAIFVIVTGLLTYSLIRFRSRRRDDGSEPPQTEYWPHLLLPRIAILVFVLHQHLVEPGRASA